MASSLFTTLKETLHLLFRFTKLLHTQIQHRAPVWIRECLDAYQKPQAGLLRKVLVLQRCVVRSAVNLESGLSIIASTEHKLVLSCESCLRPGSFTSLLAYLTLKYSYGCRWKKDTCQLITILAFSQNFATEVENSYTELLIRQRTRDTVRQKIQLSQATCCLVMSGSSVNIMQLSSYLQMLTTVSQCTVEH